MIHGMAMMLAISACVGTEPLPLGHLVVAGGGAWNPTVAHRTLEISGGDAAKVLVIPHASTQPQAGSINVEAWLRAGAKFVSVLDLENEAAALAAIESADLIWISGGDQGRLVRVLEKTKIPAAIRKRYREGATIGGTSAGAAAMSATMIARSAGRPGTPDDHRPVLAEGLGLWPEVVIDQHFLKRNRGPRLDQAVHDHAELVGLGIDESTAVIVSGSSFEVVGISEVWVIDARDGDTAATRRRIRLTDGMTYNLEHRPASGMVAGSR